jgi:hypothetical protein
MKQIAPLALALTMGLAVLAKAEAPNAPPNGAAPAALFREGQQVVLVGEITSSPKHVAGVAEEQKMQVAIGPGKTDYTLHLKDAQMIGQSGAKIQDNDLVDHMWVRAEGTVMDDPRRIKVAKLQVVGKDMPGLQSSAFYRPGFDQGYVMAVAGSRQIYPETTVAYTAAPMVIIGKVSDDTGPLETTRKIQVDAAGNTWTMSVPKDTPIYDVQGQKISVHQIAKGQWVRIHGWQTDDLRLRAARIENIGPEDAFRASSYFRGTEPMGYVERTPGTGVRFNPLKITGVVTAINMEDGSIVVKDDNGMERTVSLETVTLSADGRPVDVKTLQKGQRVTVEGNEILFP